MVEKLGGGSHQQQETHLGVEGCLLQAWLFQGTNCPTSVKKTAETCGEVLVIYFWKGWHLMSLLSLCMIIYWFAYLDMFGIFRFLSISFLLKDKARLQVRWSEHNSIIGSRYLMGKDYSLRHVNGKVQRPWRCHFWRWRWIPIDNCPIFCGSLVS